MKDEQDPEGKRTKMEEDQEMEGKKVRKTPLTKGTIQFDGWASIEI